MLPGLEKFSEELEPKLNNFLDEKIKKAGVQNQESGVCLQEDKNLILAGGKRIRPALVNFGYQAVRSDKPNKAVFEIGVALELFHAFALIHDDIIDKALTRRGQPTAEQNLKKRYANSQ